MKVFCKDVETYRRLKEAAVKYPQMEEFVSLATVITPEELIQIVTGEYVAVETTMMLDEPSVISMLADPAFIKLVSDMTVVKTRPMDDGDNLTIGSSTGSTVTHMDGIPTESENDEDTQSFGDLYQDLFPEGDNKGVEAKREPRVAIVGGGIVGAGLLAAAADKLSRSANVDERAYLHNPFGFQNTDFGRESGKNSRRPMVTSAKGHPYPLPKSPRGVPRLGRTRGR
ncbi:hypothetical protein NRE35_004254 [Salmonella enterica]|nr:hypothetical protein [Salmonella enterica]